VNNIEVVSMLSHILNVQKIFDPVLTLFRLYK